MVKCLLVCSGGGHLTELSESMPDTFDSSECVLLTYNTLNSINNVKARYLINPHTSLLKFVVCFIQSLFYFLYYRPRFLISTGAGIAVPMIFISWLFKTKIIYIESAANVTKPSRTGQFAYKYAACFIIQSEKLRKFYPKAKLGRLL